MELRTCSSSSRRLVDSSRDAQRFLVAMRSSSSVSSILLLIVSILTWDRNDDVRLPIIEGIDSSNSAFVFSRSYCRSLITSLNMSRSFWRCSFSSFSLLMVTDKRDRSCCEISSATSGRLKFL